jgi:hypothetical protein
VKSLKARLFISGVEGIPLDVIELTLKQSNNDPSVAFNRLLEVARLYEGEKPTPVGSQGPKFSRVGPGLSSPIQQLSLEDRVRSFCCVYMGPLNLLLTEYGVFVRMVTRQRMDIL